MLFKAKGGFDTKSSETTEAVYDLDLRKSIVYKSGTTTEFQLKLDLEAAGCCALGG